MFNLFERERPTLIIIIIIKEFWAGWLKGSQIEKIEQQKLQTSELKEECGFGSTSL